MVSINFEIIFFQKKKIEIILSKKIEISLF